MRNKLKDIENVCVENILYDFFIKVRDIVKIKNLNIDYIEIKTKLFKEIRDIELILVSLGGYTHLNCNKVAYLSLYTQIEILKVDVYNLREDNFKKMLTIIEETTYFNLTPNTYV